MKFAKKPLLVLLLLTKRITKINKTMNAIDIGLIALIYPKAPMTKMAIIQAKKEGVLLSPFRSPITSVESWEVVPFNPVTIKTTATNRKNIGITVSVQFSIPITNRL